MIPLTYSPQAYMAFVYLFYVTEYPMLFVEECEL